MQRLLSIATIVIWLVLVVPSPSAQTPKAQNGHYLFAWTGDRGQQGKDFLAVIDADPTSPTYGHLLTTLVTDQTTLRVHHTEYTMPESAMLFANDHDAGRTFVFDLRNPLHPSVAASFTDMADHGKLIRSASSADPAFPDAWLTPYSLVPLPELDRVVSTNSSMQDEGMFRGVTYQVWRLSDLKLLSTNLLDVGKNRYAQISPEEPGRGPDGTVFVQTLACGLERITGAATDHPVSQLVYTFPGDGCGVPTIVGHFLIEPAFYAHVAIVLDIANGAKPVEVSRVKFDNDFYPHWTAWDATTRRLVITPGLAGRSRLYLLHFDAQTGALKVDDTLRDNDGKAGFNFENRDWPHGWKGWGWPHGVIFSR